MMQLFSYKLTHDTGFAPNPFGYTLTLATCKPMIRRAKRVGEWLAGFTSTALTGDRVGKERLVYLMRIGEKCHLRDYFGDPRFQDKIPNLELPGALAKVGDNIYRPLVPGACEGAHFEQLENPNHWAVSRPSDSDRTRDISGQYVLVADEFYYFGGNALSLPTEVRPWLPKGQSAQGRLTPPEHARCFIQFIRERYTPGRHGQPTQWPDDGEITRPHGGPGRCGSS
ncbi:hypothetical protein LMK08_00125 [Metapseudomonas furukawaii]|uniref:Nmad2 family putative nucleotide modification protein n=1 Tax=Metapseudomonas furukawaii TaxID=1149133 RepID=UPI00227B9EE3|nr:hypothetical protein [Pseudomonas furukawaii]WAG79111.1 hypothetical protein LMK08_00125 [Pseudomonas furukawaii]